MQSPLACLTLLCIRALPPGLSGPKDPIAFSVRSARWVQYCILSSVVAILLVAVAAPFRAVASGLVPLSAAFAGRAKVIPIAKTAAAAAPDGKILLGDIPCSYRYSHFIRETTIGRPIGSRAPRIRSTPRSEEHTSELQSLMRNSYTVFCLN